MSNAIHDFKNVWYDQYDGLGNIPVTDNHKKIWKELCGIFEGWINNGKYLLNKAHLGMRIMQQPRKGESYRRLRQEPWLFVSRVGPKQNAIYVKIVMCSAGIRIGVDFYVNEAEKDSDIYTKAFEKCFTKVNDGWQIENERFSIYKLIEYKENGSDEKYKNEFIELLARSIEQYEIVTDKFIEIKREERQNSGKIEKKHSEADLFFFTLDKIDKRNITNGINGTISLCGVEYKEKQLFCRPCNCEDKYFCDALKWIRAGIVTAFSERHDFKSIKQYFGIGTDNARHYKEEFQFNEENITIATNADANTVISDAIDAFDYFKENKSQFKVIFKYPNKDTNLKRRYLEELVGKENIFPYNGKLEKNKKTVPPNKTVNNSYAHNRIIFGAPGTGKSHKANLDANKLLLGERKEDKVLTIAEKKAKSALMERVTFHPEYSYYDFVGSYKPVMRDVPVTHVKNGKLKNVQDEQGKPATEKKIAYEFVPGPFTRILVKALEDQAQDEKGTHPHLLLVEEINRARVAAVFGDIFQLLDRTKEGESEYSICISEDLKNYLEKKGLGRDELKLPPNLYIWATMNSADQGVYPLDTAFKRRWSMEYLDIDTGEKGDDWNTLRKKINELLLKKGNVNEDKLMGYYFLKPEERANAHLEDSLKGKVLMYLFDDAAKPCRKYVFKETKGSRTYSSLREAMSLSKPNLGIFEGDPFWPVQPPQNDQDNGQAGVGEAGPGGNLQ